MAVYKRSGDIIDVTPVAAVTGGDVVVQDNDLISVAISDIAAGEEGQYYIRGSFEFDTSETLAVGANAFWDAAAEEITSTDTDVYAGRVTKGTYNTTKVEVSINFKHEVTGS